MATISGEKTSWTEAEATLQQLKAKKNKSNLFLIKSYSFIDKTNSHLNNNNNNNVALSNNNNNKSNKKATSDLRSPDMEPFPDIASLMLAQEPTKKARLKAWQPQKQPKSSKAKRNKAQKNDPDREQEQEQELSEQEAQLLRRNAHEYEELLEHLPTPHATLPRPQSLPGKVHFEAVGQALEQAHPIPAKRRGNNNNSNIKRESFLRQSLQSIRRSFGSNKHSSKHSIANGQSVRPLASPAGSSNASTSSTSSSTTSSYSSSTAISLLSKAQAQNHMLDEYLPTPVVLLLNDDLGQHSDISDGVYRTMRSTSSVVCTTANNNHNNNSGTDDRATTSMAPPQLPTTSPTTATATNLSEQELQQQQQQQQQHELHLRRQQYGTIQLSLPETFGPQFSSLPQSYSSSVGPLQSSGSAQSLGSSPSPSPRNSQVKAGGGSSVVVGLTAGSKGSSISNTAKQHEQQSLAVAGISSSTSSAAAAAAAGVSLNNGGMPGNGGVSAGNVGLATYTVAAGGSVAAIPPEKEKKRKEVSSSRVKKFHRHFSQVSKDEKLINYFSCALVGDIPLQGHLYITEEHFAFYSNVFGYVTKVVIPTSSVTKISKEKTAKIIPNAVGVATADERHVFGSFISRESAFRLMCTVCTQLNPGAEILLPKPLQLLPVDVELTEEYMLDDDSSCSISGNESPPQLRDPAAVLAGDMDQQQQQAFLRQRPGSDRHSEMQTKASLDVIDGPVTIRSSAPPVVHYEEPMQAHLQQLSSPGAGSRHLFSSALPTVMGNGSGVSGSSASSSSSPVTVVGMGVCVALPTTPINTATAGAGGAGGAGEGNPAAAAAPRSRWRLMAASARTRLSLDVPALSELQVLYLGITLAVLLAIFSVFLLYRVLDIEAKTSLYNMPVDFNARGGNDDDIFAEALRWQRELQDKSTAEAQHILAKNLEQISKVRRSLETLSMLIHDRRAGYGKAQTDMDLMAQNGAAAAGDVSD